MTINISDITTTKLPKLKELDLITDSEGCLQKLSEHEEKNIIGGSGECSRISSTYTVYYF